jgi:succinate-acetate transporter protein
MSSEKHLNDVEHNESVDATAPRRHVRPTRIANPAPAGIFSFASTTFMLSLFNLGTRHINHPNVVVGMAIFTGGLLQFIAGMWEFPRGNVFGATAFSSYGAFWMSYATIFIPSSGIIAAYTDPQELGNALGIYLTTWCMVTIFFILPCLRRNLSFVILLSILALAFACLAASQFTGNVMVQRAGGGFGVATALVAYYIGISDLLTAEAKPIARLPLGVWYSNE